MKTNPDTEQYEFPYTQADFNALRALITDHTGIELPDHKRALVYTRLVRRLRTLNMPDFATYVHKLTLEVKSGTGEEIAHTINAITTNVTSFFREPHHFEHLAKTLPELVKTFGSLHIWCAAASTGEEPWSIAMVVHSFKKTAPGAAVKITATDIDTTALTKAKAGVYALDDAALNTHQLMKKYLEPTDKTPYTTPVGAQKAYQVKDEIRSLVNFAPLNLQKPWVNHAGPFHIVFCRNVIIYFSKETQRALFKRIEPLMPSKAVLYLGHSESLLNVSTAYTNAGKTAYLKA